MPSAMIPKIKVEITQRIPVKLVRIQTLHLPVNLTNYQAICRYFSAISAPK